MVRGSLAEANEREAWRWLLQFVDDFRGSGPAGRGALIEAAPAATGANRYDAALAALVEHLCAEADMSTPAWTSDEWRVAEPWWFVAGLPGLEAAA
ncbi:MAG: hypothetical protein ACYDH5_20385, partial [Acidimicrobiales bacterium]